MGNNQSFQMHKKKMEALFRKHSIVYSSNSTDQLIFDECPFCNKKRKLYMDKDNMTWHCFSCEESGNAVTFISKLEDVTTRIAYSYLIKDIVRIESSGLNGLKHIQLEEDEKIEKKFEIDSVIQNFSYGVKKFLFTSEDISKYKRFYLYLIKRGIDKRMVDYFGIRYSTFQERLIFPVYYNNRLMGWQGRAIQNDVKPKAMTGPVGYKKAQYLYNYDRVGNSKCITIVEGPIDACKTLDFFPLALFGKTLSVQQFELIRKLKKLETIYIGLDPEETDTIEDTYKRLNPFYNIKIINIEVGSDCGDKTPEEIGYYVQHSVDFNSLTLKLKKLEKN